MRILAYEHFTALGARAPANLRVEGGAMLVSLALDLAALGHEVVTTVGAGIAYPWTDSLEAAGIRIRDPDATAARGLEGFRSALREVDAAWIVAPETRGRLETLTRIALAAGRRVVGSNPGAIAVAGSKLRTWQVLDEAGVPAVPTLELAGPELPREAGPWGLPLVVKPDDGVGSEGVALVRQMRALAAAWSSARRHSARVVVQPYVAGVPASVSLVAGVVGTFPLAVQLQLVNEVAENGESADCTALHYVGGEIPLRISPEIEAQLLALARNACSALRGLAGFVGVDLILGRFGPAVVEVNPRLTTSYLGLRQAADVNPAELTLAAWAGRVPRPLRLLRRVSFATTGKVARLDVLEGPRAARPRGLSGPREHAAHT